MNTYRKGAEFERKVRKKFEERGYSVIRSAGSKGADLFVKELFLSLECKSLKNFSAYRLMDGSDALVVKANRREPLVVIPLDKFLELLER